MTYSRVELLMVLTKEETMIMPLELSWVKSMSEETAGHLDVTKGYWTAAWKVLNSEKTMENLSVPN